jgi:ATP-dependent Clp protease ATP-binding subunit ClpA
MIRGALVMMNSSIFSLFGYDVLDTAKKTLAFPLKNHQQLPLMIDTLSRREHHHLALTTTCSEKIKLALIETLAQHLQNENTPKALRDCHFIYFDMNRFVNCMIRAEQVEKDFLTLANELRGSNKRLIFAVNQANFLRHADSIFMHWFKTILFDDLWRVILFTHPQDEPVITAMSHFYMTNLIEPSKNEFIGVLKAYRLQLENYHQVIISDETVANAFTMAAHYLPGHSRFDKTLELLDSAAARASATERHDPSHKAVVSSNLLAQVISSWTEIPLAHLASNKFQAQKFVDVIRKQVFGQDTALNFMASLLQNACINLQDISGPLCSFLLVGPSDVGKTATAYAIAEHLFGHKSALLHINFNKSHYKSLDEIKIYPQENNNRHNTLLSAIRQTPYAVVLIEHADQIPADTFDLLKDIFTQGYVFDEQANQYDFRHAIIIVTTHCASEYLTHLSTSHSARETSKSVDLMQLVLNEHIQDHSSQESHSFSPQELSDELLPKLAEHFPSDFLQKLHIVPFTPLDYAAFEKIIRLKIKTLSQRLHVHFGIELSFAPEIIKFLAHEIYWRKANTKSLDSLLDQHLYACVSHEILLHAENKNRSKRLLIQLNDAGQLLRCEFIASNEGNLYSM